MRLLADENVPGGVVGWLREQGHDVLWAAEHLASFSDADLLQIANASGRILLTRDKDFGYLAFHQRKAAPGVILLRIAARNQDELLQHLQPFWVEITQNCDGRFVVVTNSRVRIKDFEQLG